ncbi:NUDIX hydrolase [Devosia sp.]|uniref:NUDIX hydrolase n=1 Tax=Devosia sp. TaxID=1871048 RepID=UPI003A8DFEAB
MLNKAFSFLRRFGRQPVEPAGPQVGALPYTIVDGQLVVLLITSRGRGKWIFPKGGLMDGKTPWDTAAHEAWEEAGVEGDIDHEPIGSYWLPVTEERPAPIEVKLYPLRVARQREDWKERGQRYRHWAVLPEAKRLITHEGLADVAVALAQRELGSGRHHDTPSVAITE